MSPNCDLPGRIKLGINRNFSREEAQTQAHTAACHDIRSAV
jgi:hypothetical protein